MFSEHRLSPQFHLSVMQFTVQSCFICIPKDRRYVLSAFVVLMNENNLMALLINMSHPPMLICRDSFLLTTLTSSPISHLKNSCSEIKVEGCFACHWTHMFTCFNAKKIRLNTLKALLLFFFTSVNLRPTLPITQSLLWLVSSRTPEPALLTATELLC